MAIPVKCPFCQHDWQFKGNPDKIFVTCPGCYRKVQLNSKPEKPSLKAPPALKVTKARLGAIPQGATITGAPILRKAGREVLQETITVASPAPSIGKHESPITFRPSQHSLRMIRGSELWKTPTEIHLCEICGHKLFEDLRFNCMVDEKVKVHGSCIAEQAVLESGGDLQAASTVWGIPISVLQDKAKKLIKIIGEENYV